MNLFVASSSERTEFYLKLLEDKNPNVRKKASQSLGKIGDTSSLPRLKAQLEREQAAGVRKAIEQAIAAIEP